MKAIKVFGACYITAIVLYLLAVFGEAFIKWSAPSFDLGGWSEEGRVVWLLCTITLSAVASILCFLPGGTMDD